MDSPFVRVHEVSKVIKKQSLVEGISFEVAPGHVLALCGGNGAGKSTVLRMLAGILQPTIGEITVNQLRWSKDRKAYSKQLGYMPDDYQFSQGLTAEEALTFWAALRKVPGRKNRVEEVLTQVGLEDKRKVIVNTFSKGMRQRLLLAQALLAEPPLLIMDEPTNGLDPFWMNEFVKQLQQIKAAGQTVVFSTHQLEVAENTADQIVFLSHGRNVGAGSTAAIRKEHGSLYAAFNHSLGLK
ncbi:heme ABC exporter ATP-binding protein CcmA [Paenibacillus donghaensis]|uniref:heme ABC exporter ATP-binding protein CcmA n=1 Tax=Paenibacillus donghaensis TaxID=414771 RepID=UPI001FEB72A8|nr:heme ABC exporter ATP-binding protein CcmA [Paenibacillus donghaensis]